MPPNDFGAAETQQEGFETAVDEGREPSGGTDSPADETTVLDDTESEVDASAGESTQAVDPNQEWRERYEQRIAELEASIKRGAEEKYAPRAVVPDALNKPQDQWTVKDWQEYNQYVIDQRLAVITEEQQWRGRLSAAVLGEGNDYDSVVEQQLYANQAIQRDPNALNFVRNLDPINKYMLGLTLQMAAKAKGDHVRVIQALRGALSARQEGAKDIQRAVTSKARQTQMGIIRGGRPSGASQPQDAWDEPEEAFRARVRRNS